MSNYQGREVPLSAAQLARLASPEPDPETRLLEAEERAAAQRAAADQDEGDEVLDEIEEMRVIMREFLPREEAYLLEAHFARGQSQDAIAERLGRVKQSVQYRVHRAMQRVRWVRTLKTWDRGPARIRRDLGPLEPAHVDFAVVLWANRWNQSRTAQWFGATQAMARIGINRLHVQLAAHAWVESVEPYFADLTRVIEERAWNMGVAQVQGSRAIKFPRLGRRTGR
jgi:hypothetical protein